MEITSLNQLDLDKTYTYADYLLWKFQERVELLKGRIFKMSPAPNRKHQRSAQYINQVLYRYFEGNCCEVYFAPFDVRLPSKSGEVITVVQPDLCVICDRTKLDDKGCNGAPELIVEILSPGNSAKEMGIKFNLYEESGVQEYWLVQPAEKAILVYTLEEGKFIGLQPVTLGMTAKSRKFDGLEISADEVFRDF
ncbi:Endonuclease, Uma2 family (restriction endonuclease fold) [Cruoricaptor ignavus]|uniref:Endonuclease, Uma2 family (Restriction endonuclease fold) n=1 Tax=Cruoricaptor ignavus TaxID=1118202 RepID=A0A1M6EAE2_9FLAO|nr:Uma2 family endonuclease [Cruoricaptor ignavus]SHI82421.1 Endonuclease, Uma2 family (restriction endonuclease fold) [Cruoricaptor ignavus]